MRDQFSKHYEDLLEGSSDGVDRIVGNVYFPRGVNQGGFRGWGRLLNGSDRDLDNAHRMRMAGRFRRRLRAWAKAHPVPVVDGTVGERKHAIAEQYLSTHQVPPGLFMSLVFRSPAWGWDVQRTGTGQIGQIEAKKPWPYVHPYHFQIRGPEWGHITIPMSGHPPFGAQDMLNGHE